MKIRRRINILIFVLISICSSFDVLAIDIIVHPQHTLSHSDITVHELRQIYTMRQRVWNNGDIITVFILPTKDPLHQSFSKDVLKIFPYQLDRIWRKLTYSGLGQMPLIVNSVEELKIAVSSTPGAIGYIDKYNEGDKVNVIKIIK